MRDWCCGRVAPCFTRGRHLTAGGPAMKAMEAMKALLLGRMPSGSSALAGPVPSTNTDPVDLTDAQLDQVTGGGGKLGIAPGGASALGGALGGVIGGLSRNQQPPGQPTGYSVTTVGGDA